MAAIARLPLALKVPAVAAASMYLDGRYNISGDVHLISQALKVVIAGRKAERRDRINVFYALEDLALSKTHCTKTFLKFNGKSWTYRQAYENVLKYGTWLTQKHGIGSGEIVAMDLTNSEVFVWVWFGLWSIGAKPAFVNYNLASNSLIHTIRTSTARLVLVGPQLQHKYDAEVMGEVTGPKFGERGSATVVFLDGQILGEIDAVSPLRPPDSARGGQTIKDLAMLIYTSGTTGLPKPAVMSWSRGGLTGQLVTGWLPIKPDDVFFTAMPLYHTTASVLGLVAVLRAGATLAISEKFHRKRFWDEVRATDATIIQYVGETLRYLLSLPSSPLDKQHKVHTAFGNGCRPDVWPLFKKRFGVQTIAEFYGSTEGVGAFFNRSRNTFTEGAIGRSGAILSLLAGASQAVVVPDFEKNAPARDPVTGFCTRVKPGEPGELIHKLDPKDIKAVYQGYYGNEKASSSKVLRDVFTKGDAYYSSGDLLRRDAEGRWFFCDRIGDTFRWKSENVSTAEVSDVISKIAAIMEANVYGVEVPNHDGRAGCAAIVLSDERKQISDAQLSEIAAQAMKGLPRYAIPIFLRIMRSESAEANRTGTNKQQKVALQKEGISPRTVAEAGDELFWLPPGGKSYQRFSEEDFRELTAGKLKL